MKNPSPGMKVEGQRSESEVILRRGEKPAPYHLRTARWDGEKGHEGRETGRQSPKETEKGQTDLVSHAESVV